MLSIDLLIFSINFFVNYCEYLNILLVNFKDTCMSHKSNKIQAKGGCFHLG